MTDQTENPRHALKRLLVSEFDVPNPSMIRDTIVDRFVLIDRATLPEDPGYSIDNYTNADGFWDSARRNIATALAIEASLREQAEKEAALDQVLDAEAFALAVASGQWKDHQSDEFFETVGSLRKWRAVAEKARELHARAEGNADDVDEGLGAYVKPEHPIAALDFRRVTLARYLLGLPDNTTVSFFALQDSTKKAIDRIIELEDRANESENNPGRFLGDLSELLEAFETSNRYPSLAYLDGTRAVCRDVRSLIGQMTARAEAAGA